MSKLYFRTNTNKTNKSIHNAKHNETNSKTKISMMCSFTDTKLEGRSSDEPEKVLEKLITNYSKINDRSKFSAIPGIKTINGRKRSFSSRR